MIEIDDQTGLVYTRGSLAPPNVNFIDNEIPTGVVDGYNPTFTLLHAPSSGSASLYLNGLRMTPGTDFSISGNTITMLQAIPQVGDALLAGYRY